MLYIKGRVVLNFLTQNTTLRRSCTAAIDKFYFLVENSYFPQRTASNGVFFMFYKVYKKSIKALSALWSSFKRELPPRRLRTCGAGWSISHTSWYRTSVFGFLKPLYFSGMENFYLQIFSAEIFYIKVSEFHCSRQIGFQRLAMVIWQRQWLQKFFSFMPATKSLRHRYNFNPPPCCQEPRAKIDFQ